ncbi:nucleotide-diphospho-sugar transferase [Pedobacter sp. MW01-1-1]|uniref:nucleotide-diphospho-sugar transferase n=1 Tax=Pedobacter sp. MW01-1-1 TaxID=3383027 RepID=UPI003FEEAE1D
MYTFPILLLIFNRPEETNRVFLEIRKQKPKQFFIAADGPRLNNEKDILLCAEARKITSLIDWDCEVKLLFRDENLGCGLGPASSISWFFNHVEAGVILEDDCIPNESFFDYCENLLYKYDTAENIMMICGTSYQTKPLDEHSYYFSKYPHVWGWATWKRAWDKYTYALASETAQTRQSVIKNTFKNQRERNLWKYNLGLIVSGLDAWDYQWMYWIWKNNGLCITPWNNLISNIGFGPNATHTFDESSNQSKMVQHLLTDIIHPKEIKLHKQADKTERFSILIPSFTKYYQSRLKAALNKLKKILFDTK